MSKKHSKKSEIETQPPHPIVRQFSKKEHWSAVFVLTLLVVITYANTYGAAFVSDDTYGILNNPSVGSWSSVIAQPFHFIQPFVYFAMYNLFGLTPFAFRFWNILAHIGNVQLIFIIISSLFTPLAGFFAAGIFAVHPMLLEPVTWISGGTFTWFTFFMLLSFYFYLKHSQGVGWYLSSLISYCIALSIGAPAVVFAGVFFVYEMTFSSLKKNWKYIVPYFVLSTLFGIALLKGLGARESSFRTQHYQTTQYYNWFLQMPVALSKYFELYVWPSRLSLYHSELQFTTGQFVWRVIIMSMYFLSLVVTFFKQKKYFFLLALYLIGLVPTLTPQTVHWVTAERYAYLSMVGIIGLTGVLLARIPKKWEVATYLVFVLIVIGCMVRSIVRNNDWQNEDTLWVATAITSPSDPKTHNNLADVYMRHKEFKKAAEELIIAIKINPLYADAYHNLGNIYQQVGQTDAAINMYDHALKLNPLLWQTHQNMASVYFAKNDFEQAEAHMAKASELYPISVQLKAYRGFIQLKAGKKAQALETFQTVLQLDPQNQIARAGIAEASK